MKESFLLVAEHREDEVVMSVPIYCTQEEAKDLTETLNKVMNVSLVWRYIRK